MHRSVRGLMIGISASAAIGLTVTLASRLSTTGAAITGVASGAIAGAGSASVVMGSSRRRTRQLHPHSEGALAACRNRVHELADTVATLDQSKAVITSLQDRCSSLEEAVMRQETKLGIATRWDTSYEQRIAALKEDLAGLGEQFRSRANHLTEQHTSSVQGLSTLRQELSRLKEQLGSRTEEERQRFQTLYASVVALQQITEKELKSLQDRYDSLQGTIRKELDGQRRGLTPRIEGPKLPPRPKRSSTTSLSSPEVPSDEEALKGASQSVQEAPPAEQHDIPEIRAWLDGHGITIKEWAEPDNLDSTLDDLANYIGNNYGFLKEVIRFIKTKVRDEGVVFQFYESEEEKAILRSLGEKLERLSWFECTESSNYRNRLLYKPLVSNSKRQEVFDFFNSTWLERYAFVRTTEVLDAYHLHYERAKNLKLVTNWTDQREFELDVLYLVNGKPLWIECKAWKDPTAKVADLISYLRKYKTRRDQLGIPKEHALALVLNLSDNQDTALKRYQDFSVVQESDFLGALQQIGSTLRKGVEGSEVMP